MSDSPDRPATVGSELEALVARAVVQRMGPLREELSAVGRAVASLADRGQPSSELGDLAARLDALAARVDEVAARESVDQLVVRLDRALAPLAPVPARLDALPLAVARTLEVQLINEGDARRAQADELRQTMSAAIEQAVVLIEAAVNADAGRIAEQVAALEGPLVHAAESRQSQIDGLKRAFATAIDVVDKRIESARAGDTQRILEQLTALQAPLVREAETRRANVDELRSSAAAAVDGALERIEQARAADAANASQQGEEVSRRTVEAIGQLEAARAADASRLLDQIATLASALVSDAETRNAQADDYRQAMTAAVDQAIARSEAGRTADTTRLLERFEALDARTADTTRLLDRVDALDARTEAAVKRSDEHALALLAALDDRLQAVLVASAKAGEIGAARLAEQVAATSVQQGRELLAGIDERTAVLADLGSLPQRMASEVGEGAAGAVNRQIEPLIARLTAAVDSLAHAEGRIEALARGNAGEARAVEERVATMLAEIGDRAETAVDRGRARIAEGQVALGTRFDGVVADLLTALQAANERLEAKVDGSIEQLKTTGGRQNGALLDAVTQSSQKLGDGLVDVRTALIASGAAQTEGRTQAERLVSAVNEGLDGLRSTIDALGHDPRLDAIVVELMASRQDQLTAVETLTARIGEVGPLVARALLAEVERAARSASAAEEAVASLRPESLRAALVDVAGRSAEEIRAAAERVDATVAALADQTIERLSLVAEGQAGVRADLAEVMQAAGTGMDDLRAVQAALRQVVEDGAHKAELAALDVRGLRDRLAPHLVAITEATTRRAEADEAGFDAVLARIDQLLALQDARLVRSDRSGRPNPGGSPAD